MKYKIMIKIFEINIFDIKQSFINSVITKKSYTEVEGGYNFQ